MIRTDLMPRTLPANSRTPHLRALLASCVFHALVLGLLVTLLYRENALPKRSGSAPGAPSITLSTLVIISAPPPVPPTVPAKPALAVPTTPPPAPAADAPTAVAATPPPNPEMTAPPPDIGVPILAPHPEKKEAAQPQPEKSAAKTAVVHRPTPHAIAVAAKEHSTTAASATPSSYAPGINLFPHPPYPAEASDHGQTGTVVVNVQFDARGGVAEAEVTQSSGVPILDASTRLFIRAHWHSPVYAGQTVSVPVQYTLENL